MYFEVMFAFISDILDLFAVAVFEFILPIEDCGEDKSSCLVLT